MIKAILQLLWDAILIDLAKFLGFNNPTAQASFTSALVNYGTDKRSNSSQHELLREDALIQETHVNVPDQKKMTHVFIFLKPL